MRAILEELRDAVGLASSLVNVTLVSEETGIAKTGGSGGTAIEASRAMVDFEDARIDEVRVVVNGKTSTAGYSVRVVDVTGGGSTVLCTVTLPTTTQGCASSGAPPCPESWRFNRSVGRRGSHKLRMRRAFTEEALITFPLHDPSPKLAVSVADELRIQHRRAPCFRCGRR